VWEAGCGVTALVARATRWFFNIFASSFFVQHFRRETAICRASYDESLPQSGGKIVDSKLPGPVKASIPPNLQAGEQMPGQAGVPWPASPWPRGTISRVCRECGGRRVIFSAAGPLPCPACISWQRRPDYNPERQLLTLKDLNLHPLDQGEVEERQVSEKITPVDTDKGRVHRRRLVQMTEERRLAIKRSMQQRGPLNLDHRRRISNAMRERYALDPSLRQAGRPKRCSHCGAYGHNRKRCPELESTRKLDDRSELLDDGDAESEVESTSNADGILSRLSASDKAGVSDRRARMKTCSLCGEVGHTKRSCPATAKDRNPQKMILIEELEENVQEGTLFPVAAAEKTALKIPPLDIEDRAARNSAVSRNASLQLPQGSLFGGPVGYKDGNLTFPLPSSPEQCVIQAVAAVLRAWYDGIRRQSLEILLPQAGSDGDGWPGGIRQQFRVALPMIEALLLRLKAAEGLEGRITAEWLDEGDCVGAWQSERLAAVLFPTADVFPDVRRIDDALSGRRLMLVVNPQWQLQGQVISDFGFGVTRRSAERFIASLEEVYYLRRVRMLGDEVRVLHCYPGRWQVHYVRGAADVELIAVEDRKPTYQRLLELLKGVSGSRASKSWLDRALDRSSFDEIGAYDGQADAYNEGEGV